MRGDRLPLWWSIGRLVGHVEPIASVQKETHGDALAWAVAQYELRPEEIVISQVPPGRLVERKKPPPKGKNK